MVLNRLYENFYFKLGMLGSYSKLVNKYKKLENLSSKELYASFKSGLYDLRDLNQWISTSNRSKILEDHYLNCIRALIDKDFLFKTLNKRELHLIQNGWQGINEYVQSFGLVPFVSSSPWTIEENLNYKPVAKGPLISVIVPAFNAEQTISLTIKSILKQTYRNLEIIIVNDGSTDKTSEIIEKFIDSDKRISIINLKHNQGAYVARNIGLNHSTGEFITIHDADDISHPQKLEVQISTMIENRKYVASISYWFRVDQFGRLSLSRGIPILRLNLSSLLFRKSIINEIGQWKLNRFGADLEFYERIKCVYSKKSIKKIYSPLAIGLYRENSLTTMGETSVYTKKGLKARMDYEEKWRREHLAEFYPTLHKILSFIDKKILKM